MAHRFSPGATKDEVIVGNAFYCLVTRTAVIDRVGRSADGQSAKMGNCKIGDVKCASIIKRGNGTRIHKVHRTSGVVGNTSDSSCTVEVQGARVGEIRKGCCNGSPISFVQGPGIGKSRN